MTSRFRKWLMDSPPVEWSINQVRELLIGALRQGSVPQHIAFVMDGNRRWARERRVETVEGHSRGSEALAKILEVCYRSGVKTVTVYAFSIENFKRSKREVDALMDMAMIKLTQTVQHGELLDRYGARVRVIGQRSLLKPDLIAAIEKAEQMTSHNTQCTLNICFSYTSQEEITSAVRGTVEEFSKPVISPKRGFQEERIANTIRSQHLTDHAAQQKPYTSENVHKSTSSVSSISDDDQDSSVLSTATTTTSTSPMKLSGSTYPSPEQITASTINSHMYTAPDPPLDLLIRTSGVARLSDFMLWQCHETTQIVFLDTLWPEFDLWTFLPVLWEWQWRGRKEENAKRDRDQKRSSEITRNLRQNTSLKVA